MNSNGRVFLRLPLMLLYALLAIVASGCGPAVKRTAVPREKLEIARVPDSPENIRYWGDHDSGRFYRDFITAAKNHPLTEDLYDPAGPGHGALILSGGGDVGAFGAGVLCGWTAKGTRPRFRIVTGTAFGQHDAAWIRQHAPDDGSVHVADVTSAHACLGVWGPASRDILQAVTVSDLANEAFPYMTAQDIAVGPVPCLAVRVTYVGELGWELYCPTEFGARLWDVLWAAGREQGLVAGGYKAIDSLRLEKGYRVWGADISPDDTPFEAGLGFAVKLDKGDFIGRDAVEGASEPTRRLRCLTLADPRAVALGSEPVRVGDAIVGRVTSGGYGYTVGASIAYAYLPAEHDVGSDVAVEIFGEWVEGVVAAEPLYDPAGEKIRA